MSEPTLALTFADMYLDVANYIYGISDAEDLSEDQTAEAQRILNRAYSECLSEEDWSFLKPDATLAIELGGDDEDEPISETDLPDDFGGLIEPFNYGSGSLKASLVERPAERIKLLHSLEGTTGADPIYFALTPVVLVDGETPVGQRWKALWFPSFSTATTLYYRYRINPNALSDDDEYPVGGPAFGHLIVSRALAKAEEQKGTTSGVMHQLYERRLVTLRVRNMDTKPRNLGPNLDRSDDSAILRSQTRHETVTYGE